MGDFDSNFLRVPPPETKPTEVSKGKYPIDRPCSACGEDPEMKLHDHSPPFRPGYGPTEVGKEAQQRAREQCPNCLFLGVPCAGIAGGCGCKCHLVKKPSMAREWLDSDEAQIVLRDNDLWSQLCDELDYLAPVIERFSAEENERLQAEVDFWQRELNNFRVNAAHRAEQLAEEKLAPLTAELSALREELNRLRTLPTQGT